MPEKPSVPSQLPYRFRWWAIKEHVQQQVL